jgi:peptidoglycan/LPS O-acetylase OafA/YrhL
MLYRKDYTAAIYYPALDYLRGLAIMLVVLYHNFSMLPLVKFGFLGVDLFFVLSGFLITDILIRSKGKRHFFKNFYMRRILRIWPVYYATLLIILFILPYFFYANYDLQYYKSNQLWFYGFLQNYLFILKPLEHSFLLNHFWSLAIEEQFYMVWPLLIMFIGEKKLLYFITALFFLIALLRLAPFYLHSKNNYDVPFTFFRIDGILAGSGLAIFFSQGKHLSKKKIAAIVAAAAMINLFYFLSMVLLKKSFPYFPYCGFSTFAVLFGLITCRAIQTPHFYAGSKRWAIVPFFGKISFGLYIYHWPVYTLLFPSINKIFLNWPGLSSVADEYCSAIIVTLLAILMSVISYRYFERFFLSLKRNYAL